MDKPPSFDETWTGLEGETPAERASRIEREAVLLAEADAEIDAGLGIDIDDLEAWLNALEHDDAAPMPAPRGVRD